MDHRQKTRRFVLENCLFSDDDSALADADSLIQSGIVDSTGILELIEFLEQSHGFRVAPEEMIPANFDSIDTVMAFVARKTNG